MDEKPYKLIPIAEWGNVHAGLVVHRANHAGVVTSVSILGGKPCFDVEWYTSAAEARQRRRAGLKGLVVGPYSLDGQDGIYVIKQEK